MEFDFSTMNSADLEVLVRDLWNAEEIRNNSGITYKVFKEGKDSGIDLLYATSQNRYEIVGQVKHYYRSGYAKMIADLKEKEIPKVTQLNPGCYKFATSVDLSIKQTADIYQLFSPWMKSTNDIYAKKDLNRLITEFPQVLDQHFKLWFSNSTVLQKILHYPVIGRSEDFEGESLKKRMRLYVKTQLFDDAVNMLKEKNILIITGEPGVGKTTLAELLSYELIRGEYAFTYIYDNVKEIEGILRQDDSKQLFYYDDFLGHNALEIAKAKSTESAFLNILNRIKRLKNKKFILTTRNFILTAALDESEKMRTAGIKSMEGVVRLEQYSREMRSQLLLNHIEESDLAAPYKEILMDPVLRSFLLLHHNFYPRSIEYITNAANVGYLDTLEFVHFIYANFNKPDTIWRHAYERQIQDTDRMFLNTLLSFGDGAGPDLLEAAFHARLAYEAAYHNLVYPMQAFNHSFKRLEGGFIEMNEYEEEFTFKAYTYISFVNHSLADFLIAYLKEDKQEVVRIAESALYAEQLIKRLFKLDEPVANIRVPDRLKVRLITNSESFIGDDADADSAAIALVLLKYLDEEEAHQVAYLFLKKVNDWSRISNEFGIINYLKELITQPATDALTAVIKEIGVKVFGPVLYWMYDLDEIFNFSSVLLEKYQMEMFELFKQDNKYDWNDRFTMIQDTKIDFHIDELKEAPFNEDALEQCKRKAIELKYKVNLMGLNTTPDFEKFNDYQLEYGDRNDW